MERVGVCLLLLSLPRIAWAGELCHKWAEGWEAPTEVFYCPLQHEEVHGNFCCGTCYAPYCCSSGEARLDQDRCPGGSRWQVGGLQLLTNITEDLLMDTSPTNLLAFLLLFAIMFIMVLDLLLCIHLILYFRNRAEAHQQRRNVDDTDIFARPSGHDPPPPRRSTRPPRHRPSKLSLRLASNPPTASYGTFEGEDVPSSEEDTPPPQAFSLPPANVPVSSHGRGVSSSGDEVVILSPPEAASAGIVATPLPKNNQ